MPRNLDELYGDFMSIRRTKSQSRYHIENTESEEAILVCQSPQHTEKKPVNENHGNP